MFLCNYVAWPCDLDLESVSCTVLLVSDTHTNFYYPATIGYWVTSTEYLITFPLSETVTAHAPYHVTSNRGKNNLHFWNPWPQFAYSLCHFQGATTKIKPCYRQKIAFSHYEGYKVYCACAVSRDLCIGGPPKPHDRYKILHAGCSPGLNHACQFLWRSVKGFWRGEGSILAFSIDLLRRL